MSVCLSFKRVHCDKTEKNCQNFYTLRKIIQPNFLGRGNGWWGDPFYPTFWVNRPRWSEIADFKPIIARNASAVISKEQVQLTLIGSPQHAFQ